MASGTGAMCNCGSGGGQRRAGLKASTGTALSAWRLYPGFRLLPNFNFEVTKRTGNVSLLRRLLPHAAARETAQRPLGIAPIVICH